MGDENDYDKYRNNNKFCCGINTETNSILTKMITKRNFIIYK